MEALPKRRANIARWLFRLWAVLSVLWELFILVISAPVLIHEWDGSSYAFAAWVASRTGQPAPVARSTWEIFSDQVQYLTPGVIAPLAVLALGFMVLRAG
jgi:uncharacterized membrane protein